ncbi:MAG: hypothetical protein WCG94_03335, partial [Methanothrix sp.]
LGPEDSVLFTPGIDAKKVEDRMAEALVSLDSRKRALAEEKREPLVSNINSNPGNNNISINSSLSNSSLLNSSAAKVADASEGQFNANSSANLPNVGSSSKGSFNGYYGMTASRHEMGKSGIDSRMFLSGNFEMDNAVKFQDQGVD